MREPSLMDDCREHQLAIGDRLLSVTAARPDNAFDRYWDEIL
ncbi:hypothetical protein [Streptomyces sp. NPDC057623]